MATVRTFKSVARQIGPADSPDHSGIIALRGWAPGSVAKIYNRNGQLYTAVDADLMLALQEAKSGRCTRASTGSGARSSRPASYTRTTNYDDPHLHLLLDVRLCGGSFWARPTRWLGEGSISGAPPGTTTLTGEGLQHADGQLVAGRPPTRRWLPTTRPSPESPTSWKQTARMCREEARSIFFYHRLQRAVRAAAGAENFGRGRAAGYPLSRVPVTQQGADPGARGSVPAALRAAQMLPSGCRRRRVVGDRVEAS